MAIELAERVRKEGISVRVDLTQSSLKAQVRRAFRNRAQFLAIFGEEEMKAQHVNVRWLNNEERESQQRKMPFGELAEFLLKNKHNDGNLYQ